MISADLTGLPDELYQHLFEFLNLSDVINLRLVCKFLNEKVRRYRVQKLFFRLFEDKGLFFSLPNCTFRNFLDYSLTFLLKRPLFNIEHLKFLKLTISYPAIINEDLNKFIHLEHLEITFGFSRDVQLILPKLKRLYFLNFISSALVIDAPNLQDFHCDDEYGEYDENESFLSFTHPSSVKRLGIPGCAFLRDFADLKEVEHLTIYNAIRTMNANALLDAYAKLKSVTILGGESHSLESFVHQKALRQRDKLSIYLSGIPISERRELGNERYLPAWDPEKANDRLIDEMLKNYEKLSLNLFWVKSIRYDRLLKWCGASMPGGFFDKFNHLSVVRCKTKVVPEHLIKFLASCQGLRELCIKNCEVPQSFLDELPSVTSLCILTFIEKDQMEGFDFQFLHRMYDLEQLYTNQNLIKYQGLALNTNRIRDKSGNDFSIWFDVLDAHHEGRFEITKEINNQLKITVSNNPKGRSPKETHWTESGLIKEVNYEELMKWHDYWKNRTSDLENWAKKRSIIMKVWKVLIFLFFSLCFLGALLLIMKRRRIFYSLNF